MTDLLIRWGSRILAPIIERVLLTRNVVLGPRNRLHIDPAAKITAAYLNTNSGHIVIGANVFNGFGAMLITGAHDYKLTGGQRMDTCIPSGRDITIEDGVWIGAGAIVLGPCRIGRNAVIGAGVVVTGNVEADTVIVGNHSRTLWRIA